MHKKHQTGESIQAQYLFHLISHTYKFQILQSCMLKYNTDTVNNNACVDSGVLLCEKGICGKEAKISVQEKMSH